MPELIVSLILLFTLFFLITEKLPVDLTAIGIIVALMVTRMLTPTEAVAGFANPAVITVASMFLISRAMIRTGALGFLAHRIIRYSRGKTSLAMLLVLLIVGVASAFVNNTPVVVLFIPIIFNLSCQYNLSPSKFLIPVSYASILAGTCTLIGTSTNIIVRDLSRVNGYGDIGMFELSVLGAPIALVGIFFLLLAAPRLMPGHAAPTCDMEDREDKKYLAEIRILEESPMVGKDPNLIFAEKYPSFELFELIRGNHILYPFRQEVRIQPGDVILVKGTATDLVAVLKEKGIEPPHLDPELNFTVDDKNTLIVEMIVPPQSSLIGENLMDTELRSHPDLHPIAVKRRRLHYAEQKIRNLRLQVGDILLVRCTPDQLDRIRDEGDFIIVEDVHHEILHKRKASTALSIFVAMVASASFGLADIMVCALTAIFLLVVTGCLHLRDAYRELRGEVLLLIAATIALGTAMDKTGTSQLYAGAFLDLFEGAEPRVILFAVVTLTSICTHLLSNNATAVLVLPIAVSTALGIGVDPKPFIIGVCFGASACYAIPIGYQTNLLVYGPGGYRFSDYLKLGIPLNVIVLIMAGLWIPTFWPF